MGKGIILLGLLLSGCAVKNADVRQRGPFIERQSQKSVEDLSGCIAQKWESRVGDVSVTPRVNGITIASKLSGFLGTEASTFIVVDIEDQKTSRKLSAYALKGERGARLQSEIDDCL